jgi:hypothetical protein
MLRAVGGGREVRAYDPVAMHEARRIFGEAPDLDCANTPDERACRAPTRW